MDEVQAQYETFPYPERNPADEKKRLITGSPSLPVEMDHWLWGGARDWTKPLNALVAGGGTGDGLIQLAQLMQSAGRPYQITYLDMSKSAREIAEARAKIRGLDNISFVTESLLNAKEFGEFDYIDCCGVLHHLPDPQAGFDALAAALAPDGGIGLMVYANLGRTGVYPLQDAFNSLSKGLTPQEKLTFAKRLFDQIPEGHPFKRNPNLVDHRQSDAGFFDLLLHSSDRPYSITELIGSLQAADLEWVGTPEPFLYDIQYFAGESSSGLGDVEAMQTAENLRGTIKTHIAYAKRKGAATKPPLSKPNAVPHLRGIDAGKLAQVIANKGNFKVSSGKEEIRIEIPKSTAPLIAGIDGRRSLAMLQQRAKMDVFTFASSWKEFEKSMINHGFLHYSSFNLGR